MITWGNWKLFFIFLAVLTSLAGCATEENTLPGGRAQPSVTEPSRTEAPPTTSAAPRSYTFAVCGDNRTVGIENGVLGRIIESAKDRGAAFIINTGDVSDGGGRDELLTYKNFTDSSGIDFHTAPGNHDVGRGGTSQAYEEVIGPLYYSFDYGSDHFIVLDNADDRTGVDAAQMQWYVADLDKNRDKENTFVFTHIPFADPEVPSGHVTGEKGSAGLESGKRVVEEAAMRSKVSGFFFGHIHAHLTYELNGIDAHITGGAGAPLYLPEAAGGYYHYLLVTVRGEQVDVEVVRV